ncbi:anaerobic ribonucleoside-triphosphate reductase activating protein [Lachnospiraceae bacterium C1.1]|nr:anaerobic ribonucleoside-triphosphate reductase activating protein [Lachnospiraceae bacterium C1.1]
MHIGEIIKADSANGPGIRVSVFVSGCRNHCEGCFQPETWNFDYGEAYTEDLEKLILEELSQPYYRGLTLLGGDPMEPENQKEIIGLLRKIRKDLPDKDIWLYTGYSFDETNGDPIPKTEYTDEILSLIDVMVDGKFVLAEKNLMLNFRGSENQRLIDMKSSLEKGKLVLDPLN